MEQCIAVRCKGQEELHKVALDLLHRGESDANNIVSGFIDAALSNSGIREDEE